MTFNHIKVSDIVRTHEQAVDKYNNASDAYRARLLATATEIDGLVVSKELARLCNALRATARHIRFAAALSPRLKWISVGSEEHPVVTEMWVYLPGDEYAIMKIGYSDYGLRSTDEKYAVFSRNIKNDKYHASRDQYYMVMSEKFDRILKVARANLVPYRLQELARISLEDVQSQLGTRKYHASNEFNEAFSKITNHKSFTHELERMAGFGFYDAEFTALVKEYLDKQKEKRELMAKQHHGYYIRVRQEGDEQLFDVMSVLDLPKLRRSDLSAISMQTYRAHELEALDESLPGKLATLSMFSAEELIDDIGYKVSDNYYWVLR